MFTGVLLFGTAHACGGDDGGPTDESDAGDASVSSGGAGTGGRRQTGGAAGRTGGTAGRTGGTGAADAQAGGSGGAPEAGMDALVESGPPAADAGDASDGNVIDVADVQPPPPDEYVPECVASEEDTCPEGKYCTGENTCAPGCKDDHSCGSGVCEPSHDCDRCVTDLECAGGRVCGTGVCSATCTVADGGTPDGGAMPDGGVEGGGDGGTPSPEEPGSECASGFSCCSGRCVDTEVDVLHCGQCGEACEANEFCGVSGCTEAVLSNLCDNQRAIGLLDGGADDAFTRSILAQLAGCIDTTSEAAQETASVINSNTETDRVGKPMTRGTELLVAAGGSFYQRVVDYIEATRISPVYTWEAAGPTYQVRRSSDESVVFGLGASQFTNQHDIAIIELTRAADTGSLVLVTQGFYTAGTRAAAWYFVNVMLPSLESFDESWYVYEWQDDGTDGPSNPSEFTRRQ